MSFFALVSEKDPNMVDAETGFTLANEILLKAAAAKASDVDIQPDGSWSMSVNGDEVRQNLSLEANTSELIRLGLREFGGAGARKEIMREEAFFIATGGHTAADFSWRTKDNFVRVHIDYRLGKPGVNFRLIPTTVPELDKLGVPAAFVRQVMDQEDGLVLVAGATGSGKSSTLASVLQYALDQEKLKIVTYESPVEFTLKSNLGVVIQKEIGSDCPSFLDATESAMRENAGIVMLGELRDPATILAALRLSATGHLVIGTVHAGTAVGTLARIMESAPESDRAFYRNLLSANLRAVLCQRLVKKRDGGRMALHELMVVTTTIRAMIGEDRRHTIYDQLMQGKGDGMMTMAQSAAAAAASDLVEESVARKAVVAASADEWKLSLAQAKEAARIANQVQKLVKPGTVPPPLSGRS